MNTLTYIEARDKIWNDYFAGKINPGNPEFCFCGSLCDHSCRWYGNYSERKHNAFNGYTGKQFVKMERALTDITGVCFNNTDQGEYNENKLFNGMLAALEVLKQIHRERGEVIPEDEPLLTKRNLEGEIKN